MDAYGVSEAWRRAKTPELDRLVDRIENAVRAQGHNFDLRYVIMHAFSTGIREEPVLLWGKQAEAARNGFTLNLTDLTDVVCLAFRAGIEAQTQQRNE